jgi:hypothetical protein
MKSIFLKPIQSLPQRTIPYQGVNGYILQVTKQQVVFMEFEHDVDIPEHSHESQWEKNL